MHDFSSALADIYSVSNPQLTIVDGYLCQEGAGPADAVRTDNVSDGNAGESMAENNNLKAEMTRLVENIETKARQLTELQAKFDSLEQEYLVLYKESLN